MTFARTVGLHTRRRAGSFSVTRIVMKPIRRPVSVRRSRLVGPSSEPPEGAVRTPPRQVTARVRALLSRGDPSAAADMALSEHGAELFGFLIGVLDDEDRARFIYAEVCRRAEREIAHFSWSFTLRVWLYAITRGELRARRRRRRQSSPTSLALEPICSLARSAITSRAVASLRRALPEEDRELLILRVDRRLAWREIARTAFATGPRINSASPAAVTSFLDWGTAAYPSRHTALILKDHGAGLDYPAAWNGLTAAGPRQAGVVGKLDIETDVVTGRYLSNLDLRDVVQHSRIKRVDVFGFDACEMNMLEIIYELRDVAAFTVATSRYLQEGLPTFPYEPVLNALDTTPGLTPRAVARCLAEGDENAALVATELAWIKELGDALDKLGAELANRMNNVGQRAAIVAQRDNIGDAEILDLEMILVMLRTAFPGDNVIDALVSKVETARDRACYARGPQSKFLDEKYTQSGLSVFYPKPAGSARWGMYGSLILARASRWTTFLTKGL